MSSVSVEFRRGATYTVLAKAVKEGFLYTDTCMESMAGPPAREFLLSAGRQPVNGIDSNPIPWAWFRLMTLVVVAGVGIGIVISVVLLLKKRPSAVRGPSAQLRWPRRGQSKRDSRFHPR